MHFGDGGFDVAQDGAFSQFQFQPAGVDACTVDCLVHQGHEVCLVKLPCTDIDGEGQVTGGRVVLPPGQLLAGGFQHPLAQGDDQPGFFCQRDEIGR